MNQMYFVNYILRTVSVDPDQRSANEAINKDLHCIFIHQVNQYLKLDYWIDGHLAKNL